MSENSLMKYTSIFRSSLGSSILAHKLGLTQHPKFFRPSSSTDNNFMSTNQHVETLVKNYAPPQSVPRAVTSSPPQKPSHRMFKEGSFLSVFTDMKLQRPLQVIFYFIFLMRAKTCFFLHNV